MGSPVGCCGRPVYRVLRGTGSQDRPLLQSGPWKRYIRGCNLLHCEEGCSGRATDPPEQCVTTHQLHCGGKEGRKPPFLNTLLQRRNDGSLYATIYRNRHRQTATRTFTSTIHLMSRGNWSSACLTEPRTPPLGRTACGQNTTLPGC